MTTRFLLGRRGHQLYPSRGLVLASNKQQSQQQPQSQQDGTLTTTASAVVGRHGIPAPKRNHWNRLLFRSSSPVYIGGFALNPTATRKCSRHGSFNAGASSNNSTSSSPNGSSGKWWLAPLLLAVLLVLLTGCGLLVYIFLNRLDKIHLRAVHQQQVSSMRPTNSFQPSLSTAEVVMMKNTQQNSDTSATSNSGSNHPQLNPEKEAEVEEGADGTTARPDGHTVLTTIGNRQVDNTRVSQHELATAFLEDQGRHVVAPMVKMATKPHLEDTTSAGSPTTTTMQQQQPQSPVTTSEIFKGRRNLRYSESIHQEKSV